MSSTQLTWFLEGIGAMFDPVADLVYDQGVDGDPAYVPGYGALLDPTLVDPVNLPYLGQFVGVQIPVGADPATALSLVTAEAGKSRGTLSAITAAVTRNLSGTQYVDIQERIGPDGTTADAYWLLIHVKTSEVIDTAALTAAVNAVIPGGVFWTLVSTASPTYSQATLEYQNVAATVLYTNVAFGQV